MPKFVWDIDPVMVELGPLALRYYSLLFVGVFLGGYALLKWQIVRGGGDEEDASDFIVYGVVGVLAGSRLGHVIFYDLDHALRDPIWVLKIWTGGLASHGAVVGLVVAMYYFTRKKGVTWLEGADRFAFSAALGAALVRVGNFFNSEIVGRLVPDQTWGVKFPRYDKGLPLEEVPYRYPSQLFEVALGLGVLGALWLIDRALGKEKRPRGILIFAFFALYFTGRFFVEYFKEYQVFEQFKGVTASRELDMGQILSIPGALVGYFGVAWSLRAKLPVGWSRAEPDDDDEDLDDDDLDDDEDFDQDVEDELDAIEAETAARKGTAADGSAKKASAKAKPKAGKTTKTSPRKAKPKAGKTTKAEATPKGKADDDVEP